MRTDEQQYCTKCRMPVTYLLHEKTGKPAPIETLPSENGNIQITGNTYRIVPKAELKAEKAAGAKFHLNHFASCEFAREF